MERRSFLSLLVASAAVPALAKLQTLAAPEALARPEPAAVLERARSLVARMMALPFVTREPLGTGRVELCEVWPQLKFRADRLTIADAEQFQILGVSAAGEPMLDEFLPAAVFSPNGFGTRVQFATVPPGQRIVMAVRNLGEPRVFRAMFMGSVLVEQDESEHEPLPPLTREQVNELNRDDEFDDDELYKA
jgi:hypothetical protein